MDDNNNKKKIRILKKIKKIKAKLKVN